jgi:methylmalonyl-CoA mutase cobalamin-binding subunit
MRWKKEGPLRAQLPISASVVGRYDIVIGGDVGIDRLVTDLEDAPDAAADRHSPTIIVISFPVGRNERTGRQVPALREVIIEEGLQRHGIYVGSVLIAGKGPEVKNQEAGCYV